MVIEMVVVDVMIEMVVVDVMIGIGTEEIAGMRPTDGQGLLDKNSHQNQYLVRHHIDKHLSLIDHHTTGVQMLEMTVVVARMLVMVLW